jgi:hypothetical protein
LENIFWFLGMLNITLTIKCFNKLFFLKENVRTIKFLLF